MKNRMPQAEMIRQCRKQWVERLAQADQSWSDANTLQAVLKALQQARKLPVYRQILRMDPRLLRKVASLADLSRELPILDKKKLFSGRGLNAMLWPSTINKIGLIYTSSGFSGDFAWGFEPRKIGNETVSESDVMLDWLFDIADKPTLLINALPTGVGIHATLPTVIETGPRSDSVTAALRVLRPSFGQTILVGEWPLLKAALEQAVREKAFARNRQGGPVHLITGGDWIAENWRRYVIDLLEQACPGLAGICVINLGVSELGLSVGQETAGCQRIRQAAHEDNEFRQKLFGDVPVVPTLVQYQPWRFWIETPVVEGYKRLVVTTLDESRILPMIRYCTGDWAQAWSYAQWCEQVEHAGRPDLLPKERLPVVAVFGRGTVKPLSKVIREPSIDTRAYQIREILFTKTMRPEFFSGHFVMKPVKQGWCIMLQLTPGVSESKVPMRMMRRMERILRQAWGQTVTIVPITYRSYQPGMDLNYSRKFHHLL